MLEILSDNWLLLLVGQYPNGPMGGLVATVGLALISLALEFPFGILLALGRISTIRIFYWPSTVIVYIVRGLPLLMFIFWAYFFVPIIINRPVGGETNMIAELVIYERAYLEEIIRSVIQALPSGQLEGSERRRVGKGSVR